MDIGKEIIQVQYRVSYNLPGTMVSDIPAPIYFVKFSPFFGQYLFIDQQIAHIPTFAQSIHMGVFYKQKMIGRFQPGTLPPIFYFYVQDGCKQFFLVFPSFLVILMSQIF